MSSEGTYVPSSPGEISGWIDGELFTPFHLDDMCKVTVKQLKLLLKQQPQLRSHPGSFSDLRLFHEGRFLDDDSAPLSQYSTKPLFEIQVESHYQDTASSQLPEREQLKLVKKMSPGGLDVSLFGRTTNKLFEQQQQEPQKQFEEQLSEEQEIEDLEKYFEEDLKQLDELLKRFEEQQMEQLSEEEMKQFKVRHKQFEKLEEQQKQFEEQQKQFEEQQKQFEEQQKQFKEQQKQIEEQRSEQRKQFEKQRKQLEELLSEKKKEVEELQKQVEEQRSQQKLKKINSYWFDGRPLHPIEVDLDQMTVQQLLRKLSEQQKYSSSSSDLRLFYNGQLLDDDSALLSQYMTKTKSWFEVHVVMNVQGGGGPPPEHQGMA